jgi:protein involved in polysaccharide export with SLBB domain
MVVRAVLLCLGGMLVFSGAIAKTAQAQINTQRESDYQQSRYQAAAFYRYAKTDDVTIQVNVWGAVRHPGIYEVPRNAHLNLLFSAAGGPSMSVREQVDEQTITIKLIRENENGQRRVIYEQTMEEDIVVEEGNPTLQDGDVLTVDSYVVRGVNWRDLLGIGTSLASLVITAVSLATR